MKKDKRDIVGDIFFLWSSPPCQCFSVANIYRHWKDKKPITEDAKKSILLIDKTIRLIHELRPKYWCIENPWGMLRTIIDPIFKKNDIVDYDRITVSYCQYGDIRMKPIDIWTNIKDWKGKLCKNGDNCHISAPRGSRTGTQGLKNNIERSKIPSLLFEEILTKII